MTLGRIVKNNGRFEFIELTDDEQYAAISEAISKNLALFDKVRDKVREYLKQHELYDWYPDETKVTLAVFNAVALKNGTMIQTALRRKISDIKDNGSK
jgi:hypothetical protein